MSLELTARGVASGHLRRALNITLVIAMLMLGVALVGTAQANADCGSVITQSMTLTHDIGPCEGDGLIIEASNITLDLGGHTITGNNLANRTVQEQVGIRLSNVSGVTVRNGEVRNFDAGVGVEGGQGNNIESLNVHDNFNHSTETGVRNPCEWGDGIAVLDSDNNRIENNRAERNGPYSGIALVGDSDNNLVRNNQANHNNVDNIHPNFVTPQRPEGHGPCGPFSIDAPVGRPYQDIGIRVEGPGANNNLVTSNTANNNTLNGIAIHGHVCQPPPEFPNMPPQPANTGNTISKNKVRENGFGDITPMSGPSSGSGISILRQGPLTVVCVAHDNTIDDNTSVANKFDGIFVGAPTTDNNINRNVVQSNNRHGIFVSGPARNNAGEPVIDPTTGQPFTGAINNTLIGNRGHSNAAFDGFDGNENCDNNKWRASHFVKVNQPCVVGPGRSGTAPGRVGEGPGNSGQQDGGPHATRGRPN